MMRLLLSVLVVSLVGLVIPSAFAENVPDWVKNTAGWWATDAISETEFVNAIEFLVKENIIQVNVSQTSETSQGVPEWVKNTAGWWADDVISETEFVNAIAYLIKVGIISIESTKSPESIAEMWVNGHISDDEFLANVERMIENDIITVQSDSITKTSDLPDWLVNNAGWWAARIFTNSDFSFDPGYVKEEIYPCKEGSLDYTCHKKTYNSHGLRGNEFEKEKPDNTFRIFTVGGSSTFGHGAQDSETWPAHLQKIINEQITDKEIEVINAGFLYFDTAKEFELIKNKLSSFDPDLIIMFDGWNDRYQHNVKITIQNWESVCKLGNDEGFDTIIIVQPIPITGQRVLTEQEITYSSLNLSYLQKSQQYVDGFKELDKVCTKTADFRRIFDYVQEPIFWDNGHTMSFGNKIIAENIFSVIAPNFGKTYSVIHSLPTEKNKSEAGVVYAVGVDLSGKNFDNLNLQNAVFDKADLSNTSFKNTNIEGARFVFTNLSNSNLLDRIDLSNINFAGTDLSNVSLKGKNLSGTILTGADLTGEILTGADLTGTILTRADLTDAILRGANLSGNDLTGTILTGADLTGTILTGADLSDAILTGADLSGYDLTGTILTGADLTGAILRGSDLTNTILRGSDLSGYDLTGTILTGADLTNTILRGADLSGYDLTGTILTGADLTNTILRGADLSDSNFQYAIFDNVNLENVNLYNAEFIQVDLTKIKNKSLAEADLSGTSFAYSNLSGVNLSNVILEGTSFLKADLSGQDFTVISEASIEGVSFQEANLPNSNFDGIDLSPKKAFFHVFKNKAHLNNLDHNLIVEDLFSGRSILIISTEVRGNDLTVTFFYFTNFRDANLENANFKNAVLRNASFYSANLTNADLSGADLRSVFLGEADLSNANLEGTNLQNAILDNAILTGANLKCINHPICESG